VHSTMMQRKWLLIAVFGWAVSGLSLSAETYPSKPIRMVVPYSPGGNTDVFARLIAQRLTLAWGQQVIVDNRAGGNTLIGTELVARSAPDGYTIMLTTLTFTVSPSLYKQLPYDTLKDFTPITLAVMLPNVLVVHPSVPAKSLKELIQYAKANPGKLNYASTGSGSSPHLSMELLKTMADINLVNIPYKGGGPAMADLMGGQISSQFIGLSVAIPHIKSGKLRALAVTSAKRSSVAPDIPAVAETLPGYELDTWFGVLGPGGMPVPLAQRLQEEIARILHSTDFKEHLVSLGAEPVGSTPRQFAAHIKVEIAKYAQIVKTAGIKVE
jgi:tripartite-type tricarboxylate transporter receptor subunit TctC